MTQSQRKTERNSILPDDRTSAMQIMTGLTRQMLEFALEETKLLKQKDAATLTRIQKGKELRAAGYEQAATEFKNRINEFKGMDEALIGKLEALTKELGHATRANQTLIEAMSPKKPLKDNMVNNLFLLQGEQVAGTTE